MDGVANPRVILQHGKALILVHEVSQHLWWQLVGSCVPVPAPLVTAGWVLHPCPSIASSSQTWLGNDINSHLLHGVISKICFCLPRGELQVIYPDVGDVSCIYMPKCHQYRWRIIRDWMRPRVRFPQADEVSLSRVPRAPLC